MKYFIYQSYARAVNCADKRGEFNGRPLNAAKCVSLACLCRVLAFMFSLFISMEFYHLPGAM